MSMKNIAGQPVREENFFERPVLVRKFEQHIRDGSHILIAGPRRVGKTSLMLHMKDRGTEGCHFIYLSTESVNNENEFFKRLLHKVLDTEFFTSFQKFSKKAFKTLKDRAGRVSEIGSSVKFDKESTFDFKQEFIDTLKEIELEGHNIVLMIDEFAQTLENIIEDEGNRAAVHFLQSSREIRQDSEISKKALFVYAGSIGLENIAARLNALNLLNDPARLKVGPLSPDEAHTLIRELTGNSSFTLSKSNREDILERTQWLIPFYIQLAVFELSDIFLETAAGEEPGKKKRVTKKIMDEAYARMLEHRASFEHWSTRLRKAFKKEEYNFAKGVLNLVAEKETVDKNEITNLAHKYETVDMSTDIINSLVYDGYINNHDDPTVYRFNSPLLRTWWWKNVAY